MLASLPSVAATPPAHRDALASVLDWANDWAPIADAVALLDSRRPKPVIVLGTLSRTVVANLSAAVGLDLATVVVPPMHGEWCEVICQRKGARAGEMETVKIWHVEIEWPPGTRQHASKFGTSRAGNPQCEACGHAIRDVFNWCPLLAYTTDGTPCALWTGKDCACKLLGSDVVDSGQAIYVRATGIAPSPAPTEVKTP